jgi:hypothetical protein
LPVPRSSREPEAVRALIDAWLDGARDVLGDDLVSVRLHGGLAVGDFAPAWSDVDVCAVLRDDPTTEEVVRLARRQRALHERFVVGGEAGWRSGQGLEPLLVTPEVLAGQTGTVVDVDGAGGGGRVLAEIPAFERLWASRHGVTLEGETLDVAPPSREALRASLASDLGDIEAGGSGTPIWHAASLAWMARALAFWERGSLLAKTEALRVGADRGPPLADGFRLAARMRREGSRGCAAHREALAAAFAACAPVAVRTLRSCAEGSS